MIERTWDGTTLWHELMTRNPEGARRFYWEVVGLTTEPLEGAPFPYVLLLQNGNPIGGVVPPQPPTTGWPSGSSPHWVSSFVTDDVERSVIHARALGGQVIVPPTDIPTFGRAAVLKDPEGAVFGIFERAKERRPPD